MLPANVQNQRGKKENAPFLLINTCNCTVFTRFTSLQEQSSRAAIQLGFLTYQADNPLTWAPTCLGGSRFLPARTENTAGPRPSRTWFDPPPPASGGPSVNGLVRVCQQKNRKKDSRVTFFLVNWERRRNPTCISTGSPPGEEPEVPPYLPDSRSSTAQSG